MRVAHFCDSEPTRADGVAASAGLAISLLRAGGHRVHHYYPGRLRSVPVPLRHVRLAAPWVQAEPDGPIDVVHVHSHGPVGMAGYRLAETRRVPLVLTWHTDLLACADHFVEIPIGAALCAARLRLGWSARDYLQLADRGGQRRTRLVKLGRELVGRASLVLAPSAKTAAGLAELGDLPDVRIVPTPVALPDGGAGRDEVRAGLGLSPDDAVVLSVGRVTSEKNPELLLRAFVRVAAGRPGARLVLLGARLGSQHVRAVVRDLGLTGQVILVPPVPRDRVAGFYRMADVFAFASTNDTQSLVVAEAESVGLPVVLADPALGERPGAPASTRVTCAADPEALAGALLRMLGDVGLRERTRLAGLEAAGAYSAQRYLSLLTDAYDHARKTLAQRLA